MSQLDRGLDTRLTLVCAPAGYGKTTLLSTWLQGKPVRCCWVTLDGGDNELVKFLGYVVAAIRTQFPNACSNTKSLLNALQLPPPEHLTSSLISELTALPQSVCLVLDDYHEIRQNDIHELVTGLVRYPLPMLHLVLATRHDPPFSLARLRGADKMTEIRVKDLRFTDAEAQEYLRRMLDLEVEPELVAKLVERTEGWPVGLRMAALGMSDYHEPAAFVEDFRGDHRYITGYLIDEVFARQPRPVRTFLLWTSILDRFSAALCDAVVYQGSLLGSEDAGSFPQADGEISSQEILEQLEKSNLFVTPLDQHGEWFRYHNLFRDLLAHRLAEETTEAERASLNVAASVWLEQNGFVEEALRHCVAAGDYSAAAGLIGRHRYALMNHTQWARLDSWLRHFSPEVLHADPELLMGRIWLLYQHGQYSELPAALNQVDEAIDKASLNRETVTHLRGESSSLRSLVAYFAVDPNRAISYARQSLEDASPELWIVRIFARMCLAGGLQIAGDLEAAYEVINRSLEEGYVHSNQFKAVLFATACRIYWIAADLGDVAMAAGRCLALSQNPHVPEIEAWGHYHQGCVSYHKNDLPVALGHFAAVVQQPHLSYGMCYVHSACGLALTLQAQGQPEEARAVSESATAFLLETENTTLLPVARSFQSELALRQGQIATASQWADRFDQFPALTPQIMFYSPHLTLVKTWLAQDTSTSRQRAGDFLSQLHGFAELTHASRYLIEVLALQAVLHATNDNMPSARIALEEAIKLAQPSEFIRLFVDLGPNMADLLSDMQTTDRASSEYIGRILDAFSIGEHTLGPMSILRAGQSALSEPLTNRELDILELLVKRRTNKEIAEQLVLSPNTVSTHTHNLYAKLDVHTRRQAVARAQQLGLLRSQ